MRLGAGTAAAIAELALSAIHRAYPVKPGHVLLGDGDARPPREVTPVFYGAFDPTFTNSMFTKYARTDFPPPSVSFCELMMV